MTERTITVEGTEYTFQVGQIEGELVLLDPCWKCGGDRILPYYMHVFDGECFACHKTGGTWLTEEKMVKRIKGRLARERARVRKADRQQAEREANRAAFARENPDLAFMLTDAVWDDEIEMHHIVRDIGRKAYRDGKLSEKQLDFVRRLLLEAQEKQARREAERAAAKPAPAGRQVVEGQVIKAVENVSYHGYTESYTTRITVKTVDGWIVNGNAPRALLSLVNEHRPQDMTIEEVIRGQQVRFTAELEPKDDDPTFAFFKRPTKPELLSTPDFEEADPIDLADAAAGNMTPGSEY